jgi:hypothetical protein
MFEEADDVAINLTGNGYEAIVTIALHTTTVNEERYLVVLTKVGATSQIM